VYGALELVPCYGDIQIIIALLLSPIQAQFFLFCLLLYLQDGQLSSLLQLGVSALHKIDVAVFKCNGLLFFGYWF